MQLNFKGLPQLMQRFPDDASARHYFEAQRWDGVPTCPFCGCDKYYKLKDNKTYKCGNKECFKKYTVTTGTVFHSSHIALNIWFAAMYLVSSHKKGISSHQLARDLNLTQKTAWFLLHRIREMVRTKAPEKLSGIIEVDETYMGRKFRNDYENQNPERMAYKGKISANKGVVFGMVERGGKVIVKVFGNAEGEPIKKAINNTIEKHSWLMTDDSKIYRKGLDNYKREFVVHSKREYVRGDVHTNNVENFWGVMKRGIYGTYHQVSFKHLDRYCDEFSFRYNSRQIKDYERFPLTLREVVGRLKYKQLISNEPKQETQYPKKESEWE